jgi:hypothetical protein
VRTVVNNLARARDRASFEEVDTQTLTAIDDLRCANAPLAKLRNAGCGNVILGQACYEFGLDAIVCQRHGYVCLAAAVSSGE